MDQLTIPAVDTHEEELQRKREEQDARLDQERVEQVFGLTGGELESHPWKFVDADDQEKDWTSKYWYEGVPDWAGREDFPDQYEETYRTVVRDCLFGLPPEKIVDEDGDVWFRVKDYRSSGETQCLWEGCEDADEYLPCKVCEGETEHGHIYLGDGWCEVVYKQDVVREVLES